MTAFDSTLVSASTECVSYICVSYISQLADRIFISNFTFGWSHIKYSQQFSCFPVWSICVSVLQILCKPHIVIVYCSSVWQIIWRDAEASLHWSTVTTGGIVWVRTPNDFLLVFDLLCLVLQTSFFSCMFILFVFTHFMTFRQPRFLFIKNYCLAEADL